MTPKTMLLVLHVLGVIFGVGGVLMLDVHLFRHLRGGRITLVDVRLTRYISTFVKGGLVLVWLSGITIIATAADGPASVLANPKLQAKLVIVVVLTINAVFIETLALPLIEENLDRSLFSGIGQGRRSVVLTCGAVSTTSWLCPVVLGLARELNGVVAASLILTYYAAFLIGLVAVLQAAGRLLHRPIRRTAASAAPSSGGADTSASSARRPARPDPGEVGRNRAARIAGSRSIDADVDSGQVERSFSTLSSGDERQNFLTGMFEALIGEGRADLDVDGLFAAIGADAVLSGKFAALAPDEAARRAFDRELRRICDGRERDRWASVWDWHRAVRDVTAAGKPAPAAIAAGRYAVG